MPAKRSLMFEITEHFRTAELSSAKDLLAMCREIVKGREPKGAKKPRKPRTPPTVVGPEEDTRG